MCGRFTLRLPADQLASYLAGIQLPNYRPRYNIAPTQEVLCLRTAGLDRSAEQSDAIIGTGNQVSPSPAAVWFRWGLIPVWSADQKIGARMINARSETVADKPAFRGPFLRRRCLVLADGFYEWKSLAGQKQPYYISSADPSDPLLFMAGLWETWSPPQKSPAGRRELSATFIPIETEEGYESPQIIHSCTILTVSANHKIQTLHDRMPVILDPPAQAIWLDPQLENRALLLSLFKPAPENRLLFYPVTPQVNRYGFDQPQCIEPLG
jgi:putative SOS response-associated peptidase YedK